MTRWETLTSPELGAIDRAIPVVVAISAVEQHGPHLPVGTDHLIAEHLLTAIDAALGDQVLTLPAAAAGCSDHHTDFPGTLTVRHATLLRQVEDLAASVFCQGFRTLLVLNTHGGNQGIAQVAAERIGARHREAHVAWTSWWRLAGPELTEISQTGPGGTGHACELETSLMLAIAPGLVRMELAPERQNVTVLSFDQSDMLRAGRATLYRRMSQVAPTGVSGTPREATHAKGVAALSAITGNLAGLVTELRSLPATARTQDSQR